MALIFIPFLIPRFNWEREIRGFRNFIRHLSATALYYQTELNDVERR